MNISAADIEGISFRVDNTPTVANNETEQIETYEHYKSELNLWIQRAASYCFFFIILQITIFKSKSFEVSLIPLFLLDLKIISSTCFSQNMTPLSKLFLNKEIIKQLCSISFKIMIIFHSALKPFHSLFFIIPLGIYSINQLIHKPSRVKECKHLSWLIVTISCILFMVLMLNVSLGLEGIVEWQPSMFLWPIYLGLFLCGVVLIGSVLFVFGTFISWASEEIPFSEFMCSIWFLYTSLGSVACLTVLSMRLVKDSKYYIEKYYCIFPIIFLFIFSVLTKVFLKVIASWCYLFFNTRPDNQNLNRTSPEAAVRTEITFQSRLTSSIKNVPSVLMRISSSYFKPVDAPRRDVHQKTISMISKVDQTCAKGNEGSLNERKKHFSIPVEVGVLSSTVRNPANKICEICCERFCNAVLMECGHGGICYDCSLELWKTVGNCHMCRGIISQVLKIEKNGDKIVKVHSSTKAVYRDVEVK